MARIVMQRADTLPALAEVFRERGFEGASLAAITAATGLGKGSLYHFFPGGKEEMAAAVLTEIDGWFETQVFTPLRENAEAAAAIRDMLASVEAYFRSGRRVCLVGVFALGAERDRFAAQVEGYFSRWRAALADALRRAGHPGPDADALAEEALASIQGALTLARALADPQVFARALQRLEHRLLG
ncbi:helix-turn-helix domain-containing protein [Xanthobacter sp. V4C-4]|uniref:TetR/AcrR family transcriptional regulator n=1 Tax=Xanthobacter cornucopiae TaxID=3119924 RepID=UPI003728EC18